MSHQDEAVPSSRRREWEENGCLVLRSLLSPEQLAVCRKAYEGFMAAPTKKTVVFTKDGLLNDANPKAGLRDEFFLPVLEAVPEFAEVCKELWGTSERVWFLDAEYFKKTKQAIATPFHQDTSALTATGDHFCGFWIAFEDQTPKDYAFEIVRGSHKGPVYDNSGAFAEYVGDGPAIRAKRLPKRGLPRLPEVNELRKTMPDLICSWDLKAGDVVAFHPNALHGGGAVDPAKHPERNTLVFRFFGDNFIYRDSHMTYDNGGKYDSTVKGMKEGDPYTKIPNKDGNWLRVLGPPGPEEGKEVAVRSLRTSRL